MVTLLHGDDTINLEKYLDKLKEDHAGWEVVNLDLSLAKDEEVQQALYSRPLLACGRLVVLEKWFFKKRSKPDLSKIDKDVSVIIVEKSKLTQNQIKNFPPSTKIFLFREDPIVFKFLDSLFSGDRRKVFSLYYHVLAKRIEPEMVYHLLVSHLRRILIAKEADKLTLGEIENLAPWQIEKYQILANRVNRTKLILSFKKLLNLELALKSGDDLTLILPFFILELTEGSN